MLVHEFVLDFAKDLTTLSHISRPNISPGIRDHSFFSGVELNLAHRYSRTFLSRREKTLTENMNTERFSGNSVLHL